MSETPTERDARGAYRVFLTPKPPMVAIDKLTALSQQWRELALARQSDGIIGTWMIRECADDVDALLAQLEVAEMKTCLARGCGKPPTNGKYCEHHNQSERADLVASVTEIVRDADQLFQTVGGSSRHWVRDCFLPKLNQAGWILYRKPSTVDALLAALRSETGATTKDDQARVAPLTAGADGQDLPRPSTGVESSPEPEEDDIIWRIEVFREDDGRFAAEFHDDQRRVGGMGEYAATPIGALAELCCTLIKVAEDDSHDRMKARA